MKASLTMEVGITDVSPLRTAPPKQNNAIDWVDNVAVRVRGPMAIHVITAIPLHQRP